VTPPVLRLRDACYGYRGETAVRADLEISAGEVVAVLGPNGSGKSTLVKGALGLIDCYGGSTEWFGQPLDSFRDRWRVGYVPQRQPAASPVPTTVEEVVRSGRLARNGLLRSRRAADRPAVAAALDTVGLTGRRRAPISQLSGGQQRRALVARALAGDADALVLDEPLAGVDHDSQQALADTFGILANRDVTLIVVLHELGPLDNVVTRVVHLAAGRVVYDGPAQNRPAELRSHDQPADTHPVTDTPDRRPGLLAR